MSHSEFGKPDHGSPDHRPYDEHEYGKNPFRALLIGAIAVIVALAVFLMFRDSAGTPKQVGFQTSPPPITTPSPAPRTQ